MHERDHLGKYLCNGCDLVFVLYSDNKEENENNIFFCVFVKSRSAGREVKK